MRVVVGMAVAAVIVPMRVAVPMVMTLMAMSGVVMAMIVRVTMVVGVRLVGRVIVRHGATLADAPA